MASCFDDERLELAKVQAVKAGKDAASRLELDCGVICEGTLPICFGPKWRDGIIGALRVIEHFYGHSLNDLFLYSNRVFEFERHYGACFFKSLAGEAGDSWVNKELLSPEGYADYEGWAVIVYDRANSLRLNEQIPVFGSLEKTPDARDIMRAMAIIWFVEAGKKFIGDPAHSFDILCEVSQAISFVSFDDGWAGGREYESEDRKANATEAARKRALAKHAPHTKAREKLIGIWRSGEYATKDECVANELSGLVEFCGKKIAFRVARSWLINVEAGK